jgi:hypothetical protein
MNFSLSCVNLLWICLMLWNIYNFILNDWETLFYERNSLNTNRDETLHETALGEEWTHLSELCPEHWHNRGWDNSIEQASPQNFAKLRMECKFHVYTTEHKNGTSASIEIIVYFPFFGWFWYHTFLLEFNNNNDLKIFAENCSTETANLLILKE